MLAVAAQACMKLAQRQQAWPLSVARRAAPSMARAAMPRARSVGMSLLTLPLAWHALARQESKTVARAQGAWVVPEATTRAKAGAKHREITL